MLMLRHKQSCTTMASSVDDASTLVSQESAAVVSQVHTEPTDVSRMSGASLAEFVRLHGNPDDEAEDGENDPNDPISIAAVATGGEAGVEAAAGNAAAAEAVAIDKEAPPSKKRRRMAFGSKKLLANRHLFLLSEHQNQHGDDSARIQGKIVKCAAKKDPNSKFVVDWKKPFPVGVNSLWLRKEHDNADEHRDKLQEAILECEAQNPMTTRGDKRSTSSNKTPRAAICHPSVVAAASVRTGSSTVSSITHGALSTGPSQGNRSTITSTRRNTRATSECESDSNDEHEELDETGGVQDDPVDCCDNNNEEETEEDVDRNPESTVFQHLQALKFNFREVEPGSLVDIEGPCQCNGPVGLKPGVADSFTDPFECLSLNGLDRSLWQGWHKIQMIMPGSSFFQRIETCVFTVTSGAT